ncbi:MAG: hypothetical protein CMF55_01280 [Legionellales bacterium]|mgnify:CR=1 FL=1|nr:hypothetical protein [Legionellales bacterium]HAG62150.1 hypothetical protein [Coxiellaceae bacterium]
MHLMSFFGQRKAKGNILYLTALSGEKQSFIQHIDAISSEKLFNHLLENNQSSETAWHTAAYHQQSGGFSALLQRLKNNNHINSDHWMKLMSHTDHDGNTILHSSISNDSSLEDHQDLNILPGEKEALICGNNNENLMLLLSSLFKLKIVSQKDWHDLLSIKNNAGKTVLHIALKEQIPIKHVITMFKIIGKTHLSNLLCQQDNDGYTVMDYIAQYCHNTTDLSSLIDAIDTNTWACILDWQIKKSSYMSVLHQAAHWQHKEGFKLFLKKLTHEQRRVLLLKNISDDSVIDIAAQYQELPILSEIGQLFSYKELFKIAYHYTAQSEDLTPSHPNDCQSDLKTLFKSSNIISIITFLKYADESDKKSDKLTQEINLAIHELINNPTDPGKSHLLHLLHQKMASCCSIVGGLFKYNYLEPAIIGLLEQRCDIPQCHTVVTVNTSRSL